MTGVQTCALPILEGLCSSLSTLRCTCFFHSVVFVALIQTRNRYLAMSMGRVLRSILTLALLASCYVAPLHARFTQTTCWTGENTECIQQNTRGSWCYVPTSGLTTATTCTGSSADFASVLEAHLAQGLSTAYYSGIDNTLLGGGDYPIPSNPGVIRLCVSGRSGDENPKPCA